MKLSTGLLSQSNRRRDSAPGMPTLLRLLLCSAAAVPAGLLAQESAPAGDGELEEIVVTGSQVALPGAYSGGQVASGGRVGIFGNLDMMDSPFVSTNYTADLMLDQQSQSVADVLKNDPVVRVARGFGNFQELYVIRGFPIFSDDMTYNGIYGILPRQYVAAELLERVEVFRGASAFLNGAAPGGSGLGGAVNLVPKRAPEEPVTRPTIGYESDGQVYLALDAARRFGSYDSTGVRVNAVRRDGESSVEDQDRQLTVLSAGVDYQGDAGRLSADLGFQDQRIDAPRPSVTPLGAIPEPPDASSNFAQPWTLTDERQLFGVVRGEYDLTDNTVVWAAAGMRDGREENVLVNPASDADGNTSEYRFDNYREDQVYSGDIGLRTELETGAIGHRFIVSAARFSLESRNAYAFSNFAGYTSSLYDPVAVAPPVPDFFVGGSMADPHVTQEVNTASFAIADMLSFRDETVLLTLGARFQNIEAETFDYNTGAPLSNYDEGRVTPVVGLVVKPSERLSLYANYIEGLIPGEIAPATSNGTPVSNAGEVFDPYQADQYEIGMKYDSGDYGLTLSAFTLSKPSAFVVGDVFTVAGEQQNQGIELSIFGAPLDNLRVLGGATFLNTEMKRTQGGVYDGKDAIGSPEVQVNANVEWDVPAVEGLTLDARVIYTSSQYADSANFIEVDAWTRLGIGARYTSEIAGKDVVLRARIENLADSDDWISVGGYPGSNYLILGTPRTLALSASMSF